MTKDMFIDSPRDYSNVNAVKIFEANNNDTISAVQIEEVGKQLHDEKNALGVELRQKVEFLSIAKPPLALTFSGKEGEPLTVSFSVKGQPHSVCSSVAMFSTEKPNIDRPAIEKRFNAFNNTDYSLEGFNFDGLETGLGLPFKVLTALKNEVAYLLNDSQPVIAPVELPVLEKHPRLQDKTTMSILISDESDVYLCDLTDGDVYFKLPESWKRGCDKHIAIFQRNPQLIPWFPAVLIGKDYDESVRLLEVIKPARIVSNNTGVAYAANEMGISWIAGPFLNTTNSFALLTLQQDLNCAGAFISNEINRLQIRNIARPANFKMLYSIYHPILMMTSRQCFFQQTVGCKKPSIEDGCMLKCEKATTITNVKGISFAVDKQKGGYPSIYNDEQFLNTDIISDLDGLFDEFFIDLTNIGAGSKEELDKAVLVKQFAAVIAGDNAAGEALGDMVVSKTQAQYSQGL
jgi:putative protease